MNPPDESWTSVDAAERGRWSPQPEAPADWPVPDERMALAQRYGPCVLMHNQFRCMHGGHTAAGSPAEWIADAPTTFCARKQCPLTAAGQPLLPVAADRAALPGFALLVCPQCDEAGRQAHSTRPRTAAVERPPCLVAGCGGLTYVRVVTANADVDAWMAAGRQRQQARTIALARAQAPRPAQPTLAGAFDVANIDGPTVLGHWLFECTHGAKKSASKGGATWIDNQPGSTCRTCNRSVTAVPTDRTNLTGFALLSCRACLADGHQPNSVRMHVKSTDRLTCRRDSTALNIRAIVARTDIDQWLAAGEQWLVERGAAEMAANMARAAHYEAFHAALVHQCTDVPQPLAHVYGIVHGASQLVGMHTLEEVAQRWLSATYPMWTKRHADAPQRLAAILAQVPPLMAHKCNFCGADALIDATIQMAPRFCDDVRVHLRLPDATRRLTIGCVRGGCAADGSKQNCLTCIAAPSSNHRHVLARQQEEQQRGLAEQLCMGNPLKAAHMD